MTDRRSIWVAVLAGFLLGSASAGASDFDVARMAWADRHIEAAIEAGKIPGAVLLVGRNDEILYRKAYGLRAVEPEKVPMTPDTVFDLASLTKPIACATSVMLLVERGQLNLNDRVSTYIEDFGSCHKERITVADLLLHRSGLTPDNPESDYAGSPAESLAKVYALPPIWRPGSEFHYSDVGYIVLGQLVEKVDGRPLNVFAREELFAPLGMTDTGYLPPETLKPRCAPTEQREGHWMVGEVHDPRSYALGGVAGHAGLFSTADDLARYARMILAGGTLEGQRVLAEMTVREMTRPRRVGDDDWRTFGFDVDTAYSSARGSLFDAHYTLGHTGFTGTMLWLDPVHNAYVILLTNRVHPDGRGSVIDLRRRVTSVVASAIVEHPDERYLPGPQECPRQNAGRTKKASGAPADVLCGIDVLKRTDYAILQGKRVALITNHTGLDREGHRTVDLLAASDKVNLVKLFSPEHGLYGVKDEKVADGVDSSSRLKVYSLYGKTRRPTPEMLDGIDTLVFDIQDIGARFYTYVGTLGFAMEEAGRRGVEVVVLDRPNPIRGDRIGGPIYDGSDRKLVAYGPLPIVHGMTAGELARMFNAEYGLGCSLNVVACEGWRRSMWWDETALTWVNPSPNMRNLTQAAIYPGICLLEACNVSVGRGTDQPFEIFGAPWIDGRRLAAALNAAKLPGLRFVPVIFTPEASKFQGEPCGGVYVVVTDRDALQPVEAGLTICWQLKALFGSAFEIDRVNVLLGNQQVLDALKTTDDPSTLPTLWRHPLAVFRFTRAKYLMYE